MLNTGENKTNNSCVREHDNLNLIEFVYSKKPVTREPEREYFDSSMIENLKVYTREIFGIMKYQVQTAVKKRLFYVNKQNQKNKEES